MLTYKKVEGILLDNGIPFKSICTVYNDYSSYDGIEVYECGILLEKKKKIVENLLAGENVKVSAANETVRITI